MAGYDLSSSDSRIRKTLGKKLKKKIPEIRNEFIYGKQSEYDEDHNVIGMIEEPSPYCVGTLAKGYSLELSQKIFDSMEAFAKYAFNRSHSFCYAVIGFKTAQLSCHYPLEFAVANCTVNEETEKIVATLSQARKRKIDILPPDINHSKTGFTIDGNGIRYGLKAIKGVGASVLSFINKYKAIDPVPFKDFNDYYNRVHDNNNPAVIKLISDLRAETGKNSPNPMKKDVDVALILSGAFDFCEPNRYKLLNHFIGNIKKEKQVSVMDEKLPVPLNENDYKRKIKLALEKFYMGSYISEHPLDTFPYADFDSCREGEQIHTTGIVTSATMKTTKKNKMFMSIKFKTKDDVERTINVFNENLAQSLEQDIKKNQIIIVEGAVSKQFNNINAKTVKIAIASKQTTISEDIVIEDKRSLTPVDSSMFMAQEPVGFGNIF